MSEILEIYDLDSKLLKIEDRTFFYSEIKDEFKNKGFISQKVKTIRLILMNSLGRIYLQKRSKIKTENLGLYDKTVGGHVAAGDSFDITVARECAEELGFPAAVVSNEEFEKSIRTTKLDIIGIFRKIDYEPNFISERILKNKLKILQPSMTAIYIGYYDGPIKFVDGESSGIEVFSLEEIKKEIQKHPKKFSGDIKYMIEKYQKYLIPMKLVV
jgi:isopentenyldiphosphate isomerase